MIMIVVMLLMIAGGIGLAQALSDPDQVTLRWLRLGGIIAVCLLAVTAVMTRSDETQVDFTFWLLPAGTAFVVQLILVQLGRRRSQRVAAFIAFVLTGAVVCQAMPGLDLMAPSEDRTTEVESWTNRPVALQPPDVTAFVTTLYLSMALTGGYMMAMLLGHAYLTAGNEMTQRPFRRIVRALALILIVRAGMTIPFGLLPFLDRAAEFPGEVWILAMMTARYAVGLVVPALLTYMTYDCIKRAANQSATGILYVTLVLVIVGEGAALALFIDTGHLF